jgi:hypothetical protein
MTNRSKLRKVTGKVRLEISARCEKISMNICMRQTSHGPQHAQHKEIRTQKHTETISDNYKNIGVSELV